MKTFIQFVALFLLFGTLILAEIGPSPILSIRLFFTPITNDSQIRRKLKILRFGRHEAV